MKRKLPRSTVALEFVQQGDAVLVFGTVHCGVDGNDRKLQLGTIFEPTNSNPLLELKGPLGMAAVAKIVAAYTGAVILDPGIVKLAVDALTPFADVAKHPDQENPPSDNFHKAEAAWEALMRVDCGGACGHFGIVEADCQVHDWRER